MQSEQSVQERPGYVEISTNKMYERPTTVQDARKPCYLFFAGNIVEPEAARQRKYLKAGGIEVSNPCLRFSKDFLYKGLITPLLEDVFPPVPREMVDPGDTSYVDVIPPPGYVAPFGTPQPMGGPSTMKVKNVLPGDQLNVILGGAANVHGLIPRGIVEIRALKGEPYRPLILENGLYIDAKIWDIERAIFPDFPIRPVSVFAFRKLLDAAWNHTYLREIVEDMQVSSQQFEDYARATVEQAHVNIRSVASSAGYVQKYTPVDLVLLEQLEMKRRDPEFRELLSNQGGGKSEVGEIKDLFKMFLDANREDREAMMAMYERRQNAEAPAAVVVPTAPDTDDELPILIDLPVIDETTMMAAEPTGTMPDAPLPNPVLKSEDLSTVADSVAPTSEFVCGCGKVNGSLAGLKSHQRVCEQFKE